MRNYSSTAVATTIASAITSSDTSMTLTAATGLPSVPFTLVLDPDTANEEIVTVTARSGTSVTAMSRGQESTTARSHAALTPVKHMVTARDLQDVQDHIANTTTAHGVTGAVVGTTNSQTLTNKAISGSANTLTNIAQASVTNLVTDLSNKASASHTHTLANVTDVTATAAEVNVLDGITASTAELNLLDGVTATTAELNYIDGVTSNIQTQLSGKANTSHTHVISDVTGLQTALDDKLSAIYASVYKSTGSVSTDGPISYGNENIDASGFHSNSVDPSRFTVPSGKAGTYRISASVNCTYTGNDGSYKIYFTKNGTKIAGTDGGGYVTATLQNDSSFIEVIVALAVSDYVEVYLDTITGPGLSITSTFNIQYVGA